MTKTLFIVGGPYSGQFLQLPDDVAAAALTDKWAVDTTAEDHDAHNIEYLLPADPVPQSLTDFLASLDPNRGDGGGDDGNGDGGEPAAPPVLTSISPATAVVGDADFTMTAQGSGFTADSVIVFNDGEEPTTFVSDTELTTIVMPSTASGAVVVPVLVRNADGDSDPQDFTFTAAE